MNKLGKIVDVLNELRTSASLINSESTLKATMQKYDMLFMGEKFNKITSLELRHCLIKVFEYEIPEDEFMNLVPIACESLSMKTEAMGLANDPSKLAAYFITLF
ncbi:hypothetical protein [Bacillus sp. Hm123]|uniref:hypothetical protein n=1 Tax=Bacillus sp. Hm123 TaxID=3450745 RepID=UPI003F4329C1